MLLLLGEARRACTRINAGMRKQACCIGETSFGATPLCLARARCRRGARRLNATLLRRSATRGNAVLGASMDAAAVQGGAVLGASMELLVRASEDGLDLPLLRFASLVRDAGAVLGA